MIEALRVRRRSLRGLAREHGVTTRTVRRDLEAMSLAGLPVRQHDGVSGVPHYGIDR
jgi:predicted DNA-binding transcriptional regulator YafY